MSEAEIAAIEQQIAEYFKGEEIPTVSGLCLALGIDYTTLDAYRSGIYDETKPRSERLSKAVRTARYRINESLEKRMGVSGVIEMLRAESVFERSQELKPPFDMGSLKDFCI